MAVFQVSLPPGGFPAVGVGKKTKRMIFSEL
jgi:hypothetical protein